MGNSNRDKIVELLDEFSKDYFVKGELDATTHLTSSCVKLIVEN